MPRLVKTVLRKHLVDVDDDEWNGHRVSCASGSHCGIPREDAVVLVEEGVRRSEVVRRGHDLRECRRGLAIESRGFFDLDAGYRSNVLVRFPRWYDEKTHEVFVDDRYVVVVEGNGDELGIFAYDRKLFKWVDLSSSGYECPREREFHARWSRRVRSRFCVTKTVGWSEDYSELIVLIAAWFRNDDGVEDLDAIYIILNEKTGNWHSSVAFFDERFSYVESRSDDEIVLRRFGNDRSFRVPLRVEDGSTAQTNQEGLLVVDDAASTRWYDVDAEVVERIDLFALPVDAKRDVSRKATFVRDYAFDFT